MIEVINRGERWLVCADGDELAEFESRDAAMKAAEANSTEPIPVIVERAAEVNIEPRSPQNGNR